VSIVSLAVTICRALRRQQQQQQLLTDERRQTTTLAARIVPFHLEPMGRGVYGGHRAAICAGRRLLQWSLAGVHLRPVAPSRVVFVARRHALPAAK